MQPDLHYATQAQFESRQKVSSEIIAHSGSSAAHQAVGTPHYIDPYPLPPHTVAVTDRHPSLPSNLSSHDSQPHRTGSHGMASPRMAPPSSSPYSGRSLPQQYLHDEQFKVAPITGSLSLFPHHNSAAVWAAEKPFHHGAGPGRSPTASDLSSGAAQDMLGPLPPHCPAAFEAWEPHGVPIEHSLASTQWRETQEGGSMFQDADAGPASPQLMDNVRGGYSSSHGQPPALGARLPQLRSSVSVDTQGTVQSSIFSPAHSRLAPNAAPSSAERGRSAVAAIGQEPQIPRAVLPGVTPSSDMALSRTFDVTVAPNEGDMEVSHDDIVDMLDTVHGAGVTLLGKYRLLGGVHQRFGGQGVVQFAVEEPGLDSSEGQAGTLPPSFWCLWPPSMDPCRQT
jgi:hypothetical protein